VLVAVYSAFILTCVLVYVVETLWPVSLKALSLNGRNPWGVVTSLFVHGSFVHLRVNMQSLALEVVLMAILLNNHRWSERHMVALFCATPFVSAVAADVIQFAMFPNVTSFGASGVAYGVIGLVIISALRGLGEEINSHGIRACFSGQRCLSSSLDLLMFVPFVYVIVASPGEFLGAGAGVDSLIHGLGFIFSVAIAGTYFSQGLIIQTLNCLGWHLGRLRARPQSRSFIHRITTKTAGPDS
jgi:membrane associated rhomboid family serine protease